jgi:tetratricopeptide (TPR) repeat protein
MDTSTIDSDAAAAKALARINALIDSDDVKAALSFADSLTGPEILIANLKAIAYTHGGFAVGDRAVLLLGAELWRALSGCEPDSGGYAYNLANAEQNLWELAVREEGYAAAFESSRSHLHACRRLFRKAASDERASEDIRVQALTNLGNSFDHQGREIDALACWRETLALRPDFAMAHGEVGICLAGIAPLVGEHAARVLVEARAALSRALADPEQVLMYGSPAALRCFEQTRARLGDGPEELHTHPRREWSDPHLRWCHEHELFLHVSHACLSEDVECLDQIAISRLFSGPADGERERVVNVLDALNALKQDYTAARYACWLSSDPDSPLREGMSSVTRRASYIDNLNYPRWGVRTGIAIQAFAATTNLLDKVASFVHLYHRTARCSRSVYFRTLWHAAGSDRMDPELAQALRDQPNRGLIALLDLSCDLEEETPLARLLRRRNAATHRFVVAHQMFAEDAVGPWLDHVEWDQLVEQSIEQLRVARAAILYLVRAIEISEAKTARLDRERGITRGALPLHRMDPEYNEIE